MNEVKNQFNSNDAGKITPHGQALVAAGLFTEAQLKKLGAVTQSIPLVPLTNPSPWHNQFIVDLRVDRAFSLGKLREGMSFVPFFDVFNLFNHAPADTYSGLGRTFGSLNYDYVANNRVADHCTSRGRNTMTRRVQFGFRFNF